MVSKKNERSKVEREKKSRVYDPMSVTWMEKYDGVISKIWDKLPHSVGHVLVTVATFVLGVSINGNWLNVIIHAGKQFGYINSETTPIMPWSKSSLDLLFKDFWTYWISSCITSYTLYFGIGGFLHWYYYVRQRDRAEEWKIQPKKWLSPELERHEIFLGTMALFLNATLGGAVACYIANGGYSRIYHRISDYGWLWFILQLPVIYIILDLLIYWIHRAYHVPFLYKHFHKLHHKYKQPTAFSVTAIHPVESIHIQMLLMSPVFFIPFHWGPFYAVIFYNYYHGIIDHSGINFKAYWWQPWQPDAVFHDNHHQYFHVNFGFNLEIWDKLHGTYRLKDRVYREDIFYGQGKSINDVSTEELNEDLAERHAENPRAYRQNKLKYI